MQLQQPNLRSFVRRYGDKSRLELKTVTQAAPEGQAQETVAEILIYDVIGDDFWGDGITAKSFVQQLNAVTADRIVVRINSPGGHVWDCLAIYDALRRKEKPVDVHIDGLAASAASVIAMAGDRVFISETAFLFIHDAMSFEFGNAEKMTKMAVQLDAISETAAGIYAKKSGKKSEELRSLMKAEKWFTANEAKEFGLVDEISGNSDVSQLQHVAACLSTWKGAPTLVVTIPAPVRSKPVSKPTNNSTTPKMVCRMPGGETGDASDQAACEAAGGNWEEETTQQAPPSNSVKPATLQEIKEACPNAPADFVLGCLEKQHSVQQAQTEFIKMLQKKPAPNVTKPAPRVPVVREDVAVDDDDNSAPQMSGHESQAVNEWNSADASLKAEFGNSKKRYLAFRIPQLQGRVVTTNA